MSKVIVYNADNRWFIPAGDSVREIPFAIVSEWERHYGLDIREVSQYD